MFRKISRYLCFYWREALFLFFLTGLNSVLRFYKLSRKGLWHSDEIDYYMVCRDVIDSFQNSVLHARGIWQKLGALYETLSILTQYPPKFAFYLVNSLALALMDKQATMLFVSATASILTIVSVFFIGRKFFNLRVGIIASLLFSFSLIYLRYSRNAFSMALTYLFLVLSVYCYLGYLSNFRARNLYISGLLLGIAVLFHAQVFLFALLIIFTEFLSLFYFYNKNVNEFIRRITAFIPAFFLPLALLEITANLGRLLHWYGASGYFRQIYNTMTGNLVSRQGINIQPDYYLNVLWRLESPFISVLVVFSLFFIIRLILSKQEKSQPIFLISALFILPYLYWALQRRLHQVEYNCLGAWPFMFLYIALGADALFKNIKAGFLRVTAIILFLIIAASYSIYHLGTLFEIKSHYPEISRVLKEHDVKKLVIYKTGGIYAYKNIDRYLMTVEMYPADTVKEVYEIAKKEGAGFCFYGSWEYFLAKNRDGLVAGDLVAKIRDTTMRPHYPLFYMGLLNSGIAGTKDAEIFKGPEYDYLYLYKIKPE